MRGYRGYHESWSVTLWRLLRTSLLISAGLGAAAAVIAWLVGWRTLYLVGQAFWFAGVGAIALGLLSTMGMWRVRGDFRYQYSRSVSPESIGKRTGQDVQDMLANNAFVVVTLLSGVILIFAGYVLQLV